MNTTTDTSEAAIIRDALEEAAKVADRAKEHRTKQLSEEKRPVDYPQRQLWSSGRIQAEIIAAHIRTLIDNTEENEG